MGSQNLYLTKSAPYARDPQLAMSPRSLHHLIKIRPSKSGPCSFRLPEPSFRAWPSSSYSILRLFALVVLYFHYLVRSSRFFPLYQFSRTRYTPYLTICTDYQLVESTRHTLFFLPPSLSSLFFFSPFFSLFVSPTGQSGELAAAHAMACSSVRAVPAGGGTGR